ncbi:glutathione peroxidase [Bacillus endophyticus]|uniref:glutathione peroxidase n=1 Tax=Priestia endophytica TaxID=135735 RepID=UPI0018CCE364|nr:glutathione peroxidase [Priestia endophytica]MBG9811544.1 glutathione peroxidase [Priestia endophytica]
MNIYQFSVQNIKGEEQSLEQYKGKVIVVVNTASKCGFTPQFEGLQNLYEKYKDRNFVILGFPCNQFGGQEPGDEEEIQSFCQRNYGVDFPMFAKVDVKGDNAHPLFQYLAEKAPGILGSKAIKWNFTKFLIDKDGEPVQRFSPKTAPEDLEHDIEQLLEEKTDVVQ